jgi:hypothetical protein
MPFWKGQYKMIVIEDFQGRFGTVGNELLRKRH